jgi:hypothetical protein
MFASALGGTALGKYRREVRAVAEGRLLALLIGLLAELDHGLECGHSFTQHRSAVVYER